MQAKTRQQIAMEYGVCTKTLNKWFKDEGIELPNGIINPNNVNLIYSKLSKPDKFGRF